MSDKKAECKQRREGRKVKGILAANNINKN